MSNKKYHQNNRVTSEDDIPLVLSVDDLCEILSIGKNSAYNLIKSQRIASIRIGRNISL